MINVIREFRTESGITVQLVKTPTHYSVHLINCCKPPILNLTLDDAEQLFSHLIAVL